MRNAHFFIAAYLRGLRKARFERWVIVLELEVLLKPFLGVLFKEYLTGFAKAVGVLEVFRSRDQFDLGASAKKVFQSRDHLVASG